jgi:hypothetical protein
VITGESNVNAPVHVRIEWQAVKTILSMPSWPACDFAMRLVSDFQSVASAADSNLNAPLTSDVAKFEPETVEVDPPFLGEFVPERSTNAGLSYDKASERVPI